MTVVTDYTTKANENSLHAAQLTRYRFTHWLCDTIKNFMSSPVNLLDERLAPLLFVQDGLGHDQCRALFQVALPFTKDTRKACTTPAIFVSTRTCSYPAQTFNVGINSPYTKGPNNAAYGDRAVRKLEAQIAVITEQYDATELLGGLVEDFLVTHRTLFPRDNGAVSQFNVIGSTMGDPMPAGEGANAKDLYQMVIGVSAIGSLQWNVDTQGPVFRGLTMATTVS
jgi:hypothetical protein